MEHDEMDCGVAFTNRESSEQFERDLLASYSESNFAT